MTLEGTFPYQRQDPPSLGEATTARPRHYVATAIGDVDGNAATGSTAVVGGNTWYVKGAGGWTQISGGSVADADATTKGILKLTNQLGGTAALPTVTGMTETNGPTALTLGAIADGQYLKRSGTTIAGFVPTTEAEMILGKNFFSDQGFLPATTHFEDLYTSRAPDTLNLNGGTYTRSMSRARFAVSATPANVVWDIGAAKTKLLFIVGGLRPRVGTGTVALFFSNTAVSGAELPDGGYQFFLQPAASNQIFKHAAGTYTGLGSSEALFLPSNAAAGTTCGAAFYYDDSTGRLIGFVKVGPEQWFPICDVTGESTFTTMRYVGLRMSGAGGEGHWVINPMAIYYTA